MPKLTKLQSQRSQPDKGSNRQDAFNEGIDDQDMVYSGTGS